MTEVDKYVRRAVVLCQRIALAELDAASAGIPSDAGLDLQLADLLNEIRAVSQNELPRLTESEALIIAAARAFHHSTEDAEASMASENALDEAVIAYEQSGGVPVAELPAEPQGGWLYAEANDADEWSGLLETKDLAITEALSQLPHDSIFVAKGAPQTYAGLYPHIDAAALLETLDAAMLVHQESWGEEGLVFVDAAAAERELRAWARRHIKLPPWCKIEPDTIERVIRLATEEP